MAKSLAAGISEALGGQNGLLHFESTKCNSRTASASSISIKCCTVALRNDGLMRGGQGADFNAMSRRREGAKGRWFSLGDEIGSRVNVERGNSNSDFEQKVTKVTKGERRAGLGMVKIMGVKMMEAWAVWGGRWHFESTMFDAKCNTLTV
jgi:hypothetical protein